MKIIYTGMSHHCQLTTGKQYEVVESINIGGSLRFCYITSDDGMQALLRPKDFLYVKSHVRWRKVLKTLGYKKKNPKKKGGIVYYVHPHQKIKIASRWGHKRSNKSMQRALKTITGGKRFD